MKNYPLFSGHYNLRLAITPAGWSYKDLMDQLPAFITPKTFYCHGAQRMVTCHAPMSCNHDCKGYNARKA